MTDLYVFAREADPGLVGEKQSIGADQALRFVAATTGAFQALAVGTQNNYNFGAAFAPGG